MAIIKLSAKKEELKRIVSGEVREHERVFDTANFLKLMDYPDDDKLTNDEVVEKATVKEDIEALMLVAGRNLNDGMVLVEVVDKTAEIQEYLDEKGNRSGEFCFVFKLGPVRSHNLPK